MTHPKETSKDEPLRHQYDANLGKYYFSIVDVVAIVTESTNPRNYWKVLKNRLKTKQNQLVTYCNQLKMESLDGKYYLTDVGDRETILKIIEILDPNFTPYFQKYFATFEHKKSRNVISFKKLSTLSNTLGSSRENSYPQSQKSKDVFSKKIKVKSI